jgi:hypothetical protein
MNVYATNSTLMALPAGDPCWVVGDAVFENLSFNGATLTYEGLRHVCPSRYVVDGPVNVTISTTAPTQFFETSPGVPGIIPGFTNDWITACPSGIQYCY